MPLSRIDSDPDLKKYSKKLTSMSMQNLRELVIHQLKNLMMQIGYESDLVSSCIARLEKDQEIMDCCINSLNEELGVVEEKYFELLEKDDEASEDSIAEFAKARIIDALILTLEGQHDSYEEAVYELFIGSQRNKDFLSEIEQV